MTNFRKTNIYYSGYLLLHVFLHTHIDYWLVRHRTLLACDVMTVLML